MYTSDFCMGLRIDPACQFYGSCTLIACVHVQVKHMCATVYILHVCNAETEVSEASLTKHKYHYIWDIALIFVIWTISIIWTRIQTSMAKEVRIIKVSLYT